MHRQITHNHTLKSTLKQSEGNKYLTCHKHVHLQAQVGASSSFVHTQREASLEVRFLKDSLDNRATGEKTSYSANYAAILRDAQAKCGVTRDSPLVSLCVCACMCVCLYVCAHVFM